VGQLALAVAASAAQSPAAAAILERAGAELGRLACALINRFGPRPVQLAGRAAQLHPSIPAALRATLPAGTIFTHSSVQAQQGAARLAAGAARP
jgi:predicted NBD/HSP70 family sugar kinase